MIHSGKNITILSCGIGKESIPASFADIVNNSTRLIGGQRLLELFPNYSGEKIIIDKYIRETLARIAGSNESTVILASGDALFHGIARTVLDIIPEEKVRIVPNITAAQALCAKIAMPWENAALISLHGKDTEQVNWKSLTQKLPVIIYGDHKCNAANIAKKILQAHPEAANDKAAIGMNLGMEDEKIIKGPLKEISHTSSTGLSVLAIFASKTEQKTTTVTKEINQAIFGRADSEFAHRKNMITHSEVRAVILSKLQLKPGIMWDLGAGSGSVGIEAAILQPELMVYSIEKNPERVEDIKSNICKFKTENLQVVCGNVLDKLHKLPAPDTVFIGGGGDDITEILKQAYSNLKPGGTIIATAVLLETRTALTETLKESCEEVLSISVSRSKKLGNSRMMKAENNIDIYIYKKPESMDI